jgi:crotonobetainyl-CoA:carnitine CoA-transferase CaiB-like acyl-CoA transferase
MVAAIDQRNFESLARAIGRTELITDPRFRTNALRWQNTRQLEDIVEEWTGQRTADECERLILAAGVPASRYRSVAEQLENPQLQHRGSFITAEDSSGRFRVLNSPFHLRAPGQPDSDDEPAIAYVPALGADTAAVREAMTALAGTDD